MTDEQGLALARLMRDRYDAAVAIHRFPFDLPRGYVEVVFSYRDRSAFSCGIAPDGSVSS